MPTSKSMTNKGDSVVDRSRETAEKLQHHYQELNQAYGDTRARLDELNDRAVAFIRENPGVCLIGATAFGYTVGRLAVRRWFT